MTSASRLLALAVLVLVQLPSSIGLYDNESKVRVIDKKAEFEREVLQSDGIWLVEFYAPWCGHCKQFVPTYSAMASMLSGIVNVAAVDATSNAGERIASTYGVSGYPTLYIFGHDKQKPQKYEGGRDPNSMIQALMDATIQTIQARAPGQDGKSAGGGGTKKESVPSKVVHLNASNFNKKVLQNPLVSMVAFVAPWCGHCKALLPEWEIAARKVHGEGAFLGVVDATVETQLAQQYQVQGYPTIKVFQGGLNKPPPLDYPGERSSSSIVSFVFEEVDRTGVPKEIVEMTSSSIFNEHCSKKLCVLAALPHILDSGASGRNKYRDLLAQVAKSNRGTFDFVWFEGGSQPTMEETLEMTFGYPALVVLSLEKHAYIVHRGSFSEKAIRSFLTSIATGRQASVKLRQDVQVVDVEPWDGKDGKPLEEEPPLSEIMGWDDDDDEGKEL